MTITPAEALAAGLDVVAETAAGVSWRRRGTAADLTRAALDVAAFLMEYEGPPEADEEDAEVALDGALPLGPARKAHCTSSPGDYAYVRAGKSGATPFVRVEVTEDGESTAVALSPVEARAYAAGILDAADEAEGTSPLLMFRKPDEAA